MPPKSKTKPVKDSSSKSKQLSKERPQSKQTKQVPKQEEKKQSNSKISSRSQSVAKPKELPKKLVAQKPEEILSPLPQPKNKREAKVAEKAQSKVKSKSVPKPDHQPQILDQKSQNQKPDQKNLASKSKQKLNNSKPQPKKVQQEVEQQQQPAINQSQKPNKRAKTNVKQLEEKKEEKLVEEQIDTSTNRKRKVPQKPQTRAKPKAQTRGKKGKDESNEEMDDEFELSDPEEKKLCQKIATRAKRRTQKPDIDEKVLKKLALGLTKKQKKNLPEEYQMRIDDPSKIEIPDLDQVQESNSKELIYNDCCVGCTNKNVHRACRTQNIQLLEKCIQSPKVISGLLHVWSCELRWTPLEWALYHGNSQMLEILMEYDKQAKKMHRVKQSPYLLEAFETGMVSQEVYGTEVRKVNVSRGNRKGNNAFLEENVVAETSFRLYLQNEYFRDRMLHFQNVKWEHLKTLISFDSSLKFEFENLLQKFLLAGKVDIVQHMMKPYINDPIYQVNQLMYDALIADDLKQLPENYNKLSVNKVSYKFGGITALHTAAVNPNLEILKRLLNIVQADKNSKNITDSFGNQAIHYASACSQVGPLELLIARGSNIYAANNDKDTPIFIAVKANKPANISVLLQEDDELVFKKGHSGYLPIHVAAKLGYIDCIKALVKVDKTQVNAPGGFNKLTPLMYAAAYGYFETVQYLIKNLNAQVNLEDKFKRNAICYAVRNGHLKIAALLIKSGAMFNYPDSSLNFPLHYACAYGWRDCAKLLIDSGAQVNSLNEWKHSPLMISMLKNHKKIVMDLLEVEGVDVNGTDDNGRTLLSLASSQVNSETLNYLKFLIEKKGADPNLADIYEKTPLHYIVQSPLLSDTQQITIKEIESNEGKDQRENEQHQLYKIVQYLVTKTKLTKEQNDMLVQQIVGSKKLYLLPLFDSQDCINQQPKILISFDPFNQSQFDQLIRFIQSHKPIDEKIMNGIFKVNDSLMSTPLLHYINLFNSKRIHQIGQYLYIRRIIETAKLIEKDDKLEELPENPFDYYSNLMQNELDILDLEFIQKVPIIQEIQKQMPKAIYDKTLQILDNSKYKNESEYFYYNKQAIIIFEKLIIPNFMKFLKVLILKGANPNCFGFIIDVLIDEQCGEDLKRKAELQGLGIIPMSVQENERRVKVSKEKLSEAENKLDTLDKKDPNYEQNLIIARQELVTILIYFIQVNIKNRYQFNGILHRIHLTNCIELIDFFLEQGVDVNQENLSQETLLLLITQGNSSLEMFEPYFNCLSKYNLNKHKANDLGNNSFLIAFSHKNIEVAFYLVDQGLDINSQNKEKQTALLQAVQANDFEQAETLLEKGANPNIKDKFGRTALHYAVNNSSSTVDASFDMESLLITHGADVNIQDCRGRTPLHYAFVKINQVGQVNTMMDPIETVSSLCTVKNADPTIQDYYGKTALHYAAQRGASTSTIYLQKKGVNLHQVDCYGNTPLATAMLFQHAQYSIMLIQMGSDVNQLVHYENKGDYRKYLEQLKLKKIIPSDFEEIENVPQNQAYQPQIQNSIFSNPFGAQRNIYQPQVPQVEQENTPPENMFKLAVQQNQLGLSYIILDHGYDLMKAMEDSLKQQKFKLSLTLLSKVSDNSQILKSNAQNQNLFHIFAMHAHYLNENNLKKTVYRIYKQFKRREINIEQEDKFKRRPIHYACEQGAHILVEEIVKDGYQLECKDKKGKTPIILSVTKNQIQQMKCFEVFKILGLKGKVNINQYYQEPSYKHQDKIFQKEIKLSKQPYKLTPFLHVIRSYDKITNEFVRKSWLLLFFDDPFKLSIFTEKDTIGRNAVMLLVTNNKLTPLKEIMQLWQSFNKGFGNALLDSEDILGRNAIHYVVQTNPLGTYDNVELFDFLAEKGLNLDKPDKEGVRPITLAKAFKGSKIYKRLLKLGIKDSEQIGDVQDEDMEDLSKKKEKQIKYEEDAERYLEQNKGNLTEVQEKKKLVPDPIGQFNEFFEVVYEIEDDLESGYEANLIRIDFKRYGYTAFLEYKIQLLFDKLKKIYIVLTKWGMINQQGMCQKTPFNTLEQAVTEFKKIFKNKTSNEWENRDNFQQPKAKNKYILFNKKQKDFSYKNLLKPFDYNKAPKPKFIGKDIENFIRSVTNIGLYNEVMKMTNIEQTQLNMTNLPRDQLERAKEILEEAETIKLNHGGGRYYGGFYHNRDNDEDQEGNAKRLLTLSSEFFRVFPISLNENKIPEPLNQNNIKDYKNKLHDLLTCERASKILQGAHSALQKISPLDYVYKCLNTKIQAMEDTTPDYQIVHQYIKCTGKTSFEQYKIDNLYKIQREEDHLNFKKFGYEKDPTRMLLFHGTSQQNLLGILECGLKVSPMGISQHGQAFGSGIYFADQFDLSINYSRPLAINQLNKNNKDIDEELMKNKRYLLICEVAMGRLIKEEFTNQANYFAIGNQRQLRHLAEELKKPVAELSQRLEAKPQDSDESEDEFVSSEEDKEEDDAQEVQQQSVFSVKTVATGVVGDKQYDDLLEVGEKEKIGSKVHETRTLRGNRILKVNPKKINIFDTYWVGGNRTPDPAFNLIMRDGCIVPQGDLVNVDMTETQKKKKPQQQYGLFGGYGWGYQRGLVNAQSQYVVKHPERVKIRYIVELREKTLEEKNQEKKKAKEEDQSDGMDLE